ncbi:MAG: hypothetical protein AAGA99_21905 [Actinomycetota bacterium]
MVGERHEESHEAEPVPERPPDVVSPVVKSVGGYLRDHPAPVVSVLGAGLIVARLLAVSDWSAETASVLLAEAGATEVLLGLAFDIVGPACALFAIAVAFALRVERVKNTQWSVFVALLALNLTFVALATLDWINSVGLLAVLALSALAQWLSRNPDRAGRAAGFFTAREDNWQLAFVAAIAMPVSLSLFAGAEPWIPPERIVTADGAAAVVFVVGSDGDSLVIMDGRTRAVHRVEAAFVDQRTICNRSQPSLLDLVFRRESPYDDCPSLSQSEDWWPETTSGFVA